MLRQLCLWCLLSYFPVAWAASHHPQVLLDSIRGTPKEGESIVQHYCSNCHAKKPLLAMGAPKIGDTAAWSIRLKQGFARLFQHTEEGINAMPARGGCFECTDEQLRLAIFALLPETLRPK